MIKLLLIVIALFSLLLGVVGIFLPVLPTTPFLLLTTFLFAKSSSRFHQWFTNTKLYKNHIADFANSHTMKKRDMWSLLILVDVVMLTSFILIDNLILRIVIVLINALKYLYFLTRVKAI